MSDNTERITQLLARIDELASRQHTLSRDVQQLRGEVYRLRQEELASPQQEISSPQATQPGSTSARVQAAPVATPRPAAEPSALMRPRATYGAKSVSEPTSHSDRYNLERFIGENLISKLGILIVVLGIAVGAKYSIEQGLVTPLMRVVSGYLVGTGLLGLGLMLRRSYTDYSAVLVSGAMAIMYFITYAAYGYYELLQQLPAFAIMALLTVATVGAAVSYNRQVIAHIGLVGAYAVPILLGDGSGKVSVLFTYMAMLNVGILLVALFKCWKQLFYSAFVLTWSMYLYWYVDLYTHEGHFSVGMLFLIIFFTLFYGVLMAYKLRHREPLGTDDVLLLFGNALIFQVMGAKLLWTDVTEQLVGLFSLAHGVLHLLGAVFTHIRKGVDQRLRYLIMTLAFTFMTVAIPLQFDGCSVSMMWILEAAGLFWVGRSKGYIIFEKMSYAALLAAFGSMAHDWNATEIYLANLSTPLFNLRFLASLMLVGVTGFILQLHHRQKAGTPQGFILELDYGLPLLLLVALYMAFYAELSLYWGQRLSASAVAIPQPGTNGRVLYVQDGSLSFFRSLWKINYTLFFFSGMAVVNTLKFRLRWFADLQLVSLALTLGVFLLYGLEILSDLRSLYLSPADHHPANNWYLGMRYICDLFVALALWSTYRHLRTMGTELYLLFEVLLHGSALWILSSEAIHWTQMLDLEHPYGLALSLVWGAYAVLLISVGIWKRRQYLRVAAIALFAVTLLKLFFYDISHFNTLAKMVAFVSLGVLLLVVSFLYNKYKHLITGEEQQISVPQPEEEHQDL